MSNKRSTFLILFAIIMAIAVSSAAQGPRVNVMPDGVFIPTVVNTAYAWPGKELAVWGNAIGGTLPYTYQWNFGDGSPIVSGTITNTNDARNIEVAHTYMTMGPKYATLTVTDNNGFTDVDQVRIDVVPNSIDTRVNLAIEKGLKWLYLHNYGSISWEGWTAEGQFRAGAFGMEVLAFENREHFPDNDPDDDIYAEYVKQGLDIIMSHGIRDGDGIHFNNSSGFTRPLYETGIALMAIVGSMTPDDTNTAGPFGIDSLTYYEIAVEIVDYLAWAQTDGGSARGGWRYRPNYGSSDNSVSQWPAIGMEAAETHWGIVPSSYIKPELLLWTNYSQQSSSGGFGYGHANDRPNVGLTGAGICELSFCDIPHTDSRIQNALNYLNNNWHQGTSHVEGNFGNLYAMYGVAKGCRIAVDGSGSSHKIKYIGSHDWQEEYNYYLVDTAQHSDGHWNGSNYGSNVLDTDFGVLILLPFVHAGEIIAEIDGPESSPPYVPFQLDGSGSSHTDPEREIIEWLWDFDNTDGDPDWSDPDASGQVVTYPGYFTASDLPDTVTITLRVRDNGEDHGDSAMTAIAEHRVIISLDNHPPIADAGGPYTGKPGELICFDGTGSYDPDSAYGDYIVSYAWDLDGDGDGPDTDSAACAVDSTCCHQWDYIYSGQVGLVVYDTHGDSASDTSYVSVWTSVFDVGLNRADISFSNPTPIPGEEITVRAVIHCDDESDPVSDILVRFYDGNPAVSFHQIGSDQTIPSMNGGDAVQLEVQYTVADSFPRHIYVRVDPAGAIEEYDEENNEAFRILSDYLPDACDMIMVPDSIYKFYQFAMDSIDISIYLGNSPWGYNVNDINQASIRINGALEPMSMTIINSYPGLEGEVLKMDLRAAHFIESYPLMWDSAWHSYVVTYLYGGKTDSISTSCDVWMRGHISGDANGDGKVTILDVIYIIDFLYNNGPMPIPTPEVGDVNSSGDVNINDLAYLLRYLYYSGSAPSCPQTNY